MRRREFTSRRSTHWKGEAANAVSVGRGKPFKERSGWVSSSELKRGVSIFIVIVVMAVLLGIALGLNAISVRQLRNLRGIGNSVVALYAADAGIERILRVDICMTDLVEATRLTCIKDTIDAVAAPASCSDPIDEKACRNVAISVIKDPPDDRVLSNGALYVLEITDSGSGGCTATNYCGTSAGTFREATRKVEILR